MDIKLEQGASALLSEIYVYLSELTPSECVSALRDMSVEWEGVCMLFGYHCLPDKLAAEYAEDVACVCGFCDEWGCPYDMSEHDSAENLAFAVSYLAGELESEMEYEAA